MTDRIASLQSLFRPRAVAVVGASSDPTKVSGRPLRLLIEGGFKGDIYPINPRAAEVQGVKALASVDALPDGVDMAVIALPAASVMDAIESCARRGVRSLVIFSSGFAELGREGRELQERLAARAKEAGMRLLGPNCLGLFNVPSRTCITFSAGFDQGWPEVGPLGIASQSGALGAHLVVLARERNMGLSLWATTGNEADVDFADCLDYLAGDPDTRVIMGYMEATKDGNRLIAALDKARANGKPVVLMKVGASDVGAAAAASHTGSLAGADRVYDAILRDHGAYRARSVDELFDVAYACTAGIFPNGNRVGLVSMSGGGGVMMADAAVDKGLEVPELPAATQAKFKEWVPFAGTRNPVDITGQVLGDITLVGRSFEVLMESDACDGYVGFYTSVGLSDTYMQGFGDTLLKVRARFPDSPIFVSALCRPDLQRRLEAAGIRVYVDPTRAVGAMAALMRFGRGFARAAAAEPPPAVPAPDPSFPTEMPNEVQSMALLRRAGVPTVSHRVADSADAAAAFAAELGFPVAMKILSPDILHKSDIGGVLLGIATKKAARDGYRTLMERVAKAASYAQIDGVMVAPMVKGGVETILGVQRDPTFGPMVMFGLGGVFVETMKDVSLRRAPFGRAEALEMIHAIKGYPILAGARGGRPADIGALAGALVGLSRFAAAHADRLASVDLNPFVVRPEGEGALALDALVVPGDPS